MAETEGTIQFAYALDTPAGPVADADTLRELRGWRAVLRRLGLVGQEAQRYGGLGFGNLSARDAARPDEFVITASQTAGANDLEDADLVRITRSNAARFWVDASGHQPPSSETLTHAAVYRADPSVGWVFHVHSPDIWQCCDALSLPVTGDGVPYGSPAMADAVSALFRDAGARPVVFATLGHQDGIFACGATPGETGGALLSTLAQALA